MRIVNFGSLNIDHVYQVDRFASPGETLSSRSYRRHAGGKGLNQTIALARAGAEVSMVGRIGEGGEWLLEFLREEGVNTEFVKVIDGATGHAIIQVTPDGENAIVTVGGANHRFSPASADRALKNFNAGDYLLVQNEISSVAEIIRLGSGKEMKVVFNPAPLTAETRDYPLELVDWIVMNEIEGEGLTGKSDPNDMLASIVKEFPNASVVLTRGARGAILANRAEKFSIPAIAVNAVDSTAAGDAFIGYFLAELMQGTDAKSALHTACEAAAFCVTRQGAADSIPRRAELESGE
ncbi:MAG: ribokinase [Verrucomicrobiia bacterium]|jgi:ribokinase